MAVDEAARHQLYNSLESTLGPEPTSTLKSLLPPVGWAAVATKQDLATLENAIRADLHREIGSLRTELHTTVRNAVSSMIGAMFTLAALTWTAVAIT